MKENKKFTVDEIMEDVSLLEIYTDLYVPTNDKLNIIQEIVNICITDRKGEIKLSRVNKNIVSYLTVIDVYTNILVPDYTIETYDSIRKIQLDLSDLSDVILLQEMLNNVVDDVLESMRLENIVARFMGHIEGKLNDTFESLNKMLDKGDPNKIAKYLSKGIEEIAKKIPDEFNVSKKPRDYNEVVKEMMYEMKHKKGLN